MKNTFFKQLAIITALLLCINAIVAQDINQILQPGDTTYHAIYDRVSNYLIQNPPPQNLTPPYDSIEENGFLANFKRFVTFYENRINENGDLETASKNLEEAITLAFYDNCNTIHQEQWTNLGPSTLTTISDANNQQNHGRIEAISVNPENKSEIVVGGANGGIWLSIDGGMTWQNKTDASRLSVAGVSDIVRHPQDPDYLYATTKNHFTSFGKIKQGEMGIGVIYSDDGGNTWSITGLERDLQKHTELFCIEIDPGSTLSETTIYVGGTRRVSKYVGLPDAQVGWNTNWHYDGRYIDPAGFGYVNFHDLLIDDDNQLWYFNYLGLGKFTENIDGDVEANLVSLPVEPEDQLPTINCEISVGNDDHHIFTNPALSKGKIKKNRHGDIFAAVKYFTYDTSCEVLDVNPLYFYRLKNTPNAIWEHH